MPSTGWNFVKALALLPSPSARYIRCSQANISCIASQPGQGPPGLTLAEHIYDSRRVCPQLNSLIQVPLTTRSVNIIS